MFKGKWGNYDLKIITDQVVCRVRSKFEYEEENESFPNRPTWHHQDCMSSAGTLPVNSVCVFS
jgi:hypothetical protein